MAAIQAEARTPSPDWELIRSSATQLFENWPMGIAPTQTRAELLYYLGRAQFELRGYAFAVVNLQKAAREAFLSGPCWLADALGYLVLALDATGDMPERDLMLTEFLRLSARTVGSPAAPTVQVFRRLAAHPARA